MKMLTVPKDLRHVVRDTMRFCVICMDICRRGDRCECCREVMRNG